MRFLVVAILTLLYFAAGGQSISGKQSKVREAIKQFVSGSQMKSASVSFFAIDISSGDTLGMYNPNTSLCPASVTKLFSTAAALEIFGPDYTFKTKIQYTGTISNGVLNGNLIIHGEGDPALGSDNFEVYYKDFLSVWSEKVKKAGIQKINGKIIADVSFYDQQNVPDGWSWGDIGNYYGAAPLALNVYDNEFTVAHKTSNNAKDTTLIVSFSPEIPYMKFTNSVLAGHVNGDNSMIYGSTWDFERYSNGFLPLGKDSFKVRGAIPAPPRLLAMQFRETLKNTGIASDTAVVSFNSITEKITDLFTFESVPLKEIIRITNLKSMNLYAENMCSQIGVRQNKSAADGASA
ncbi:MAG: D-alanyl-D-alanine carboxypeptidase/D-alanyl-D-alanine-endopeptidase, partial [Bacteroidetes bacterium HGW-Bacteroidetes-21]